MIECGEMIQSRWDIFLAGKVEEDLKLEERRNQWWHFQMNRLFGKRREHQNATINLEETEEHQDDPPTVALIETWFVGRLVDPKYPPHQVAIFYGQCDFPANEVSKMKLQQKIFGKITDFDTPQQFVETYRMFLDLIEGFGR
jgi:hypothetical protein